MRYGVLLLRRKLGEGQAHRLIEKERVVPKAALTSGSVDYYALRLSSEGKLSAVGKYATDSTHEFCRTVVLVGKLREKLFIIRLIVSVFTRVSCGIHAGRASESVHGQTRILADADKSVLI